jgi:phenylacetaldehyde dehydrogenase
VLSDTDVQTAIAGASNAIFFNQGEVCSAGSRLYVQKSVFEQVVEGVAEQARKIKLGSGLDPATQMGPLVSDEQLARVTGYLQTGISEGARSLVGGQRYGEATLSSRRF